MHCIAHQYPNVPLIVSTGMQNESTIEKVHKILSNCAVNFALLHCISSYPTQVKDTKLSYISRYQKMFPFTTIGYSGHEIGWECSCLAIMMGAKILERHFTLDKSQKGSDHCVSLDPTELCLLVKKVRLIETNVRLPVMPDELLKSVTKLKLFENPLGFIAQACGPVEPKSIFPCELMCKHKLGKSLVFARDMTKGQHLMDTDIAVKVSEPSGIPAEFYDDVIIGHKLTNDVYRDDPVLSADIIKL